MSSCCSSPELMQKFKMIIDSQWMKWYLNSPKSDAEAILYQTNEFNRSTALVNWQSKPIKRCNPKYPVRKCGCFPSEAPIACYPMRHRAVGPDHPLDGHETVRRVVTDRKNLMKSFQFKLKERKKSE